MYILHTHFGQRYQVLLFYSSKASVQDGQNLPPQPVGSEVSGCVWVCSLRALLGPWWSSTIMVAWQGGMLPRSLECRKCEDGSSQYMKIEIQGALLNIHIHSLTQAPYHQVRNCWPTLVGIFWAHSWCCCRSTIFDAVPKQTWNVHAIGTEVSTGS